MDGEDARLPNSFEALHRPGPPSPPVAESLDGDDRWRCARAELTTPTTSAQHASAETISGTWRAWTCPGQVRVFGDGTRGCSVCDGSDLHRPTAVWLCSAPDGPWCGCPWCSARPRDERVARFQAMSPTRWDDAHVADVYQWQGWRTPDACVLALALTDRSRSTVVCSGIVGVAADGWWCSEASCRPDRSRHRRRRTDLCRYTFSGASDVGPQRCPCPDHEAQPDLRVLWEPPGLTVPCS